MEINSKMRFSRYYLIIIGIFLFLNMYLMYSMVVIKNKHQVIYMKNNITNTNTIEHLFNNSYTFTNYIVNDLIEEAFAHISTESPVLIYIYSYKECNDCILSDISLLRESKKVYEKLNILVIPIGVSSRNDILMMQSDLHSLPYDDILNEKIRLPVFKGHDSRFYVIYFNGELYMPFIPDKNNLELTRSYIKYVYQKFF